MGKNTLSPDTRVLYSSGDSKKGSELVPIAKKNTTPVNDSAGKVVKCVQYKTLCDALFELAAIEKQRGTPAFVKGILDRKKVERGELVINHNEITGGGGGNTGEVGIEDSEFKDPRLPYFVDIEYIEVGYAMTKQKLEATTGYLLWNFAKKTIGLFTGDSSSPITHRPNAVGLQIGELIAKRYRNIEHFATEFCKDECPIQR